VSKDLQLETEELQNLALLEIEEILQSNKNIKGLSNHAFSNTFGVVTFW